MWSSSMRSFISAVLLLTSIVSWATPGFALRQVGLEESSERKNLELALLSSPVQTPENRAGLSGSGIARRLSTFFQGKPSVGLEEPTWVAVAQAELPQDLYRDALAYGLKLVKAEYVGIRNPDAGTQLFQPFAHPGAAAGIPMSVNQAMGSYLFKGMGKGHKVLADGNGKLFDGRRQRCSGRISVDDFVQATLDFVRVCCVLNLYAQIRGLSQRCLLLRPGSSRRDRSRLDRGEAGSGRHGRDGQRERGENRARRRGRDAS